MRLMTIPLGALVLLTGAVMAADASLEAARRCAQVKGSQERLACFDHALPDTATTAVVVPAPAPSGDVTAKPGREKQDSGPTTITAKIAALKETRQNIYRISLDNGQVWQQMDLESQFLVGVGDSVEIQKGRLGSFRMARTSGGAWVRVNQLK